MTEYRQRKKMRLDGYDYASCGAYFITICTNERRPLFWADVGAICDRPHGAPKLSTLGEIVKAEILRLDETYSEVQVENYCIMPNHIHFLLLILSDESGRTQFAPTISRAMKQFKGAVSKKQASRYGKGRFMTMLCATGKTIWIYGST